MVASQKGRCAGCGKIDTVRAVERHTVSCEEYSRLYQQSPEKALSPAAEFARYQEQDRSEEALELKRQVDLDAKKQVYQRQAERKLDHSRERWGLRGSAPLRSAPSLPLDPGQVEGAVFLTPRPGLPEPLREVAARLAEIYGS